VVVARIDRAVATAREGAPGWAQPAVGAVAAARDELVGRVDALRGLEPDAAEALSGRLCDHLVRTTSAALLLEQAGEGGERATHKGLVGLRYARRHLLPAAAWSDAIAATVGRELLASATVGDEAAVKAAA
jgi:hypothetical protein